MKYFFYYLFLFYPLFFNAQSFKYKVGDPYKEVPEIQPNKKWYFSDLSKENLISVKYDRGLVYIQSFDARTMEETQRQKASGLPKKYELSKVDKIGDKIFVFYMVRNKKQKNYQLFAHEVDIQKCQLKNAPKQLLEVDEKVTFSYVYSTNHNNLLVYYRKRPKDKRDAVNHDIIGLHAFNQNLDLIGGKEVEMLYTEKEIDNWAYYIDNNGAPYILALHHQDSRMDTKYHLELIKYDLNNGKTKITKIEPEVSNTCSPLHVSRYSLYEGEDNHIHLVTMANFNPQSNTYKNGVLVIRVAKAGGVIDQKLYPISVEILNQYEDAETQEMNKSKNFRCQHLKLRKISIQQDNGRLYTIEEHYRISSRTDHGTVTTSYYLDVYLVKVGSDGELDWIKKLPKEQEGGKYQEKLGVKHITINNNHYFFFLDDKRNVDLDLNKAPKTYKNRFEGLLTAYKLDHQTGKLQKYSLFNIGDARGRKLYQFSTDRIVHIFEKEFIIEFFIKGKKDVLVKVKIND